MKTMMHSGLLAVFILGLCFSAGCQEEQQATEEMKTETTSSQAVQTQTSAEKAPTVVPSNPVVHMKTNKGVIQIELYPDKATQTVQNFLQYAEDNFYDGTIFHRVMQGFMIQGGGFTEKLQKKPVRAPIVNECGPALRNQRGTISMARTSIPNSATCQFFINLVDNPSLDHDGNYPPGYAVFGKVIEGMDVVDRIAKVKTARRAPGLTHVPVDPVIIQSVERVQ